MLKIKITACQLATYLMFCKNFAIKEGFYESMPNCEYLIQELLKNIEKDLTIESGE